MHFAAQNYSQDGNTELLGWLLQQNPLFLEARDADGLAPLQLALWSGAIQTADWLWNRQPTADRLLGPGGEPMFARVMHLVHPRGDCYLITPLLDWFWDNDPSSHEVTDEEVLEYAISEENESLVEWIWGKDPSCLTLKIDKYNRRQFTLPLR